MAYRQPAFMTTHSVAGRPISAISTAGGTYLTDPNKRSLVDFRQLELAVYSSGLTTHTLDVDMGSNFLFNRLVIPQGHNLSGATLTVRTDDNSGFTTPTIVGALAVPNFLVIDMALSTIVGERYWRSSFVYGAATAPQLGEYWLGTYNQLSAAAYIDPGFENGFYSQLARQEYPGGIVTAELAPARRRFSLKIVNVDMGSTDYTTLGAVLRLGAGRPFWYWPPDDVAFQDLGPFLVILDKDGTRVQEFPSPTTSPRYSIELSMIEQQL
jgi:hypothetical protein